MRRHKKRVRGRTERGEYVWGAEGGQTAINAKRQSSFLFVWLVS